MRSIADRTPPHNLEAEQGVLGSMLLDNSCIDDVQILIQPEDFYRDTHQRLARHIYAIHHGGRPVDAVVIFDELSRTDEWARIGGNEGLAAVMGSVAHAANARYYAQIVREKSDLRRLIEASTATLRDAYRADDTSEAVIERAERAILAVRDAQCRESIESARQATLESAERIALKAAGDPEGVSPTGLGGLDCLLGGGLLNGQLAILAARPSIGKTALAVTVAANAALDNGLSVLFVSLEMGRVEIGDRILSTRCRVDGVKIRNGQASPAEEYRIYQFNATFPADASFWLDDAPIQTVSRIASVARRLKRRHGLHLVVIDYLQLLQPPADVPKRASEQERIQATSRALKILAGQLACPVLCLSQLNREAEKRTDKRPQLADLRSSGAIEQDADVVLLLHRPEFYEPADRPGEADVHVAKNRSGQTGVVTLSYAKAFTLFEDYVPPPSPDANH